MVNRLIDFIYSRLELTASKVVIARKLCFEIFHRVFEVRDVDILIAHFGKLGFVLQGRQRSVTQNGNDGYEKLRTDNVHLFISVAHVDNAFVIELVFGFKHGA